MCAWRVPQGSDLRVLEHGSNCLATVGADVVEGETTSDRRSGVVREQACQWALTRKRAESALERGHRAPLEPLTEHGDALNAVGTLHIAKLLVDAAELVFGQAASTGMEECQRALTRNEHSVGQRRTGDG